MGDYSIVKGKVEKVEEGLKIHAILEITSSEPVKLKSNSGQDFRINLINEETDEVVWSPDLGYTQAVQHKKFEPGETLERTFIVENPSEAKDLDYNSEWVDEDTEILHSLEEIPCMSEKDNVYYIPAVSEDEYSNLRVKIVSCWGKGDYPVNSEFEESLSDLLDS